MVLSRLHRSASGQVGTTDYTVTLVRYVEEDEEEEGADAALQGEPWQAPQHGPRLTQLRFVLPHGVVDLRPADQA